MTNIEILHINVRSIKKHRKFLHLVEALRSSNHLPDILALTETWLTDDPFSILRAISGFLFVEVLREVEVF